MIIDSVEAIPYRIPMRKPLEFASGRVDEIEHVLLRVRTSDGIVGIADIPPRPYTYGETQQSIIAVITRVFTPLLLGISALDRGAIHRGMHRTVGNFTAKAGVDVALWDIMGQAMQQPVHRLLGGAAESVRVSHMVGFADPLQMVEEAERVREKYGITTFKVKVGRRPFRADVDVVRALREHFGTEVELYLDANRGWSAAESMRVLDLVSDLDITFFEEPCDAAEVLGRRRLVTHSTVPVVADESAPSLADAARELTTGGATAVSVKVARSGFTEAQKIFALAEGLGVEAIVGNQIDSQIGTRGSVALAAGVNYAGRHAAELSNFLDMADDLIAEPLQIMGGTIAASLEPGVGAKIDEDKLRKYRLDETSS